jgi:AraC family transcriptional regulator of adaptative response / DNA-3-methyladenine glycosylase II
MEITARARALFDLDAVPTAIDAHLRADPALRASVHAHPGLRVPGAWSGFELGVRAILGQQVTVAHATALAGRLVHALGDPVSAAADGLERAFPTPRAVAQAGPASLRELGITTRRSQTLCDLAAAVRDGHIDLTRQANVASTLSALTSIAGVGPWTAQVIAMRALGVTDALPPGDAGLLRVTKQIESRSARWSPWRSYAVMHVWTGGMT